MLRRAFLWIALGVLLLAPSADAQFSPTQFGQSGFSAASVAVGNSTQVQQFFDRLAGLPDSTWQTRYATLINGLVSDGVWTKCDTIWIGAAPDSATSLINLPNGTYTASLTAVNPTFAAGKGWTVFGINHDVLTTFNYSTGTNFTQNSGLFGAWVRTQQTTPTTTEIDLLRAGSGSHDFFGFLGNPGKLFTQMNSASTVQSSSALSTFTGWFTANILSGTTTVSQNGTDLGTGTPTTAAPDNATMQWWGNGANSSEIAAVATCSGLNSTDRTSLFNRINTFLTSIPGF